MSTNICEKRYSADACYANFYTGGSINWSADGQHLYCLNGDVVNKVLIETSQILHSFGNDDSNKAINSQQKISNTDYVDEDTIYCFAVSHEHLVTAHRSGLLRLWHQETYKLLKLWKAQHKGPIAKIEFSPCGKFICTSGAADATLRLWDFANSNCLWVQKDFVGSALLLRFHPNVLKREIYAVGGDNTVYCWNYETKTLVRKLRGHLSQITALTFHDATADCKQLVTVSRDKMLIVWQLDEMLEAQKLKVLPLYEELEGCIHIEDGTQLIIADNSGKLHLVDTRTWKTKFLLTQSDFAISHLLSCSKTNQFALVTTEQNILIYNVNAAFESNLRPIKQLVGYNDEILDMCLIGDNDRYLAVATNSKHFKLFDTENNMNCTLIYGHMDTVMSLAASSNLLISTGKDCSIRLWKLSHETACSLIAVTQQNSCHTATIGCVAFTHNGAIGFATVCQDGSMKVWQLIRDKKDNTYTFGLRYAALVHDKEVNCVTYALNNKIIATASEDKTAKLWTSESNKLLGALRGHTRGVWCVRFSPVDQIVLTSSSDCSLRIWSISNFSCLKRLEHDCTVLRAEFFDSGKFIVSATSDGLLKLWNIKSNTCVQSISEHTDRVWSLAVSTRSKRLFTGAADSKIIRFVDITDIAQSEAFGQQQATLEQEQTLQLLLHTQKELHKAFSLALTLKKPKASYGIIRSFIKRRDTAGIQILMDQLNTDQRLALLQHVKEWGTNSRYSQVANLVLQHLLFDLSPQSYNGHIIEVLTPYLQRHFKRVTELKKDLSFLHFIVGHMQEDFVLS